MSRPLRILYENAWYHVMNRGAAHATIFHDPADYQVFLKLLMQIHQRYCFEVHAYCLMPNHYHLLIRTPLANLSRGMRHLNGLYTQFYNKKQQRDGALFRGRYKAILIDAKNYLLQVSRYIHLNPVKANLTNHPKKYYWSSYKFYSSKLKQPDWLYTKEILSFFDIKQQNNKYCLFVLEETDNELENFYQKSRLLPVLGSDMFRKKISNKYLTENTKSIAIPDVKLITAQPSLEHICEVVAKHYNVSYKSLHNVNRQQGNLPRSIAIYLATELSGKKFKVIATHFRNISEAGISQGIKRINRKKNSDQNLAENLLKLHKLIQQYPCTLSGLDP